MPLTFQAVGLSILRHGEPYATARSAEAAETIAAALNAWARGTTG